MKKILFAIALFGSASVVAAQPTVAVQADAQPREIYLGDPISYVLTIQASSEVAQMPFVLPPPLGDFELIDAATPTVTHAGDGSTMLVYRFLLTTYSTGSFTIPSLDEKTAGVSIRVKSLLEEKGDEGNLRPLKGLFNFRSYFWWWVALGVLIAAMAGFSIWKWGPRRGKGNAATPTGPPRPPEELAWEAILALEDADLIAKGQARDFYFRLSEILRIYLEDRYGISALDRTTSELLSEFRRQNFSSELMGIGRAFFESADLVKFAKFTPTETEVTIDLNQVKKFINLSTPQKASETKEKVEL